MGDAPVPGQLRPLNGSIREGGAPVTCRARRRGHESSFPGRHEPGDENENGNDPEAASHMTMIKTSSPAQ